MALGIGLLMPPGPDGRPHAVYLVDMEARCSACGKEALRRYFLSTPFHSLTLRRFNLLFDAAPDAIEGRCEQCEEALQADDVQRWSMQYAPGDGQGLLIGLCVRPEAPSWRVAPHDFLDVQSQPVWDWSPDDISSKAVEVLDEAHFYAAFNRHMNPKSALRQAILSRADRGHPRPAGAEFRTSGACVLQASQGLEFWVGDAALQGQAIASHPRRSGCVVLVENGLISKGYPDSPVEWLGDLSAYLAGQSVVAFVDEGAADASLRRHFSRFPIDISFERIEDVLRVIAGDGSDAQAVLEFFPEDIANEAARTGATPGDMARVEIDRALTLLDLTTPT